ncbi:MAG: hypothetical protein AAFQ58_05660 [Pseudomonadota bacterium]
MIGVILWSDPAAEKAVIWCEDHGDLAFLSRDDCEVLPDSFFDVGDMVEFELIAERSVRRVTSVSRLQQSFGTTLVDAISQPQAPERARVDVSDSAEIIPFRLTPAMRPIPAVTEKRRRRG